MGKPIEIEIEIEGQLQIALPEKLYDATMSGFKHVFGQVYLQTDVTPICMVWAERNGLDGGYVIPFIFRDDEEKAAYKNMLFELCDEQNAKFVVFVIDMFVATSNDPNYPQKMRPSQDPSAMEAVGAVIMEPNGNTNMLSYKYTRSDDKIIFEQKAKWMTCGAMNSGFFIPPWRPEKETMQ